MVHAGVTGNNNIDAYVGTGGLLLPTTFTGGSTKAKTVASCLGCTWKYSVYCANGNVGLCAHAVVTCPAGQMRYRVWFGRTAATVAVIGSVCWGIGRPPTRRTVESAVNSLAIRYVPALKPAIQPADGTVTSVPIIARSGQPAIFAPPSMRLAGRTVSINAKAQWRWVWGDGQSEWRGVPGAMYPSTQITHGYRSVGMYRIHVQTVWSATYSIAGIGTFPVTGEVVTQDAYLDLPVRSAQTALIPWE